MLYICIPVYNEAPTIGVLLWRIRATFQEYAREYELVVYDDGSTDATAEVLEPYTRVLPLTILSGGERRGYAAGVDALCRHVAAATRYPRRDAMVLMQGDFTDRPEHLPELVKRFEGGADIVATERVIGLRDPVPVRRLGRAAPWLLRPFIRLEGVPDLTSTYRLIRISLLRDLLRERGDAPLLSAEGWAANAELLLLLAPFARRIESLAVEPRYDVRPRPSRLRAAADALSLASFGWRARTLARRAGTTLRPVAGKAAARAATNEAPAGEGPIAAPPAIGLGAVPPAAARLDPPDATLAARRRGRPRRDAPPDDAPKRGSAGDPSDPTGAEAAPATERTSRRPPRARRPATADASDVAGEPHIENPSVTPGETRRRRRTSVPGEARSAPGDELISTESNDASAAPPATDPGGSALVDGLSADAPGKRSARRGRRSRKRRPGGGADVTSSDADVGSVASVGDAAPGSDVSIAEGASDASDAPGIRPARRSRRGKRRGPRSAGTGDERGADGGGAPPDDERAPASSVASPDPA